MSNYIKAVNAGETNGKDHLNWLERWRKASWGRQDQPGPAGVWEECSRSSSRHTWAEVE